MGLLPMDLELLPPSDGRIFKLLMTPPGAKPGLIDLISGVAGLSVTDLDPLANGPSDEDADQETERLQFSCRLDDGSRIGLGMRAVHIQEDPDERHLNLKGKSVCCLADLHSSRSSGDTRRYDQSARTYQITFCSYTVFPGSKEYLHSFSLRHDATGEPLCDALRLVFVELSKLDALLNKPVNELAAWEKWLLFLRYAADPDRRGKVNEVIQSEKPLGSAGELLVNLSRDENERVRFLSKKKFLTDLQTDLATAEDRGEMKGRIEIAKNLFKTNLTLFQISDATGLSIEEVRELRMNEGR